MNGDEEGDSTYAYGGEGSDEDMDVDVDELELEEGNDDVEELEEDDDGADQEIIIEEREVVRELTNGDMDEDEFIGLSFNPSPTGGLGKFQIAACQCDRSNASRAPCELGWLDHTTRRPRLV
jgi:hypothetical protein